MAVEEKFWNEKYERGGRSGKGSIGLYRNWKWNKIKEVIGLDFKSVIDVGCGDLSFWKHHMAREIRKRKGFKYVGIDISDFIIEKNKVLALAHEFICAPSHVKQSVKADLVLVMDLLFHIMDTERFKATLENCCDYANDYLVIYTWYMNPFDPNVSDYKSQWFRDLGEYAYILWRKDMRLMASIPVPYDEFGMLYFFKRLIY